jgi:hypothetical protein
MSTAHVVSDRIELDAHVVRSEMTTTNHGVVAAHQPDPAQRLREAEAEWLFGPADPGPSVSLADRLLLASDIEFGRRAPATFDLDGSRAPTAAEIEHMTGMSVDEYDLWLCERAADHAEMEREALAVAGGI